MSSQIAITTSKLGSSKILYATTRPIDSNSSLTLMNPLLSTSPVVISLSWICLSPTFRISSIFDESAFRAAPYFDLVIDGITELNAN